MVTQAIAKRLTFNFWFVTGHALCANGVGSHLCHRYRITQSYPSFLAPSRFADLPMPRYFFNVVNQTGIVWDEEGVELSDNAAACRRALASARELLADMTRRNRAIDTTRLEVVSEGAVIDTVYLRNIPN
jgi:hypothetical protein